MLIPSSGQKSLSRFERRSSRRPDADDVGAGTLVAHLGRGLVLAQALVGGLPDMAVVRPLAEGDLGDEPGLDPDDIAAPHPRHLR